LRFELRFAGSLLGTNDILNSVFRDSSSIIEAGVTETGNIDAQSWVEADWNTNYPNWDITGLPTLQNAIQVHAAPAGGGAAAGKGANQNITSWGSERSSYVLNVTTPTVSSISLTATVDGFTGTLRTDVGNNLVYTCVIPQAQSNPTYREIKERRVPNATNYQLIWCSRANAGTNLNVSATGLSAATDYKLVVVAENGWSVRSAVTTSNFTTAAAGISRIAVGSSSESGSDTNVVPIPSAGVENGDYLVLFVAHERSQLNETLSGWTLIGNGVGFSNGMAEIAVYARVRDGSEGASVTVNFYGYKPSLAFCAAYRGVSSNGAESNVDGFSQASKATPTLSATAASCILHIWACSDTNTATQTLPNSSDIVAEVYGGGSTVFYLGVENQLSVSAGTTSARTATSTGSPNWNAMQVELLKA
jgi:hypothetical protein